MILKWLKHLNTLLVAVQLSLLRRNKSHSPGRPDSLSLAYTGAGFMRLGYGSLSCNFLYENNKMFGSIGMNKKDIIYFCFYLGFFLFYGQSITNVLSHRSETKLLIQKWLFIYNTTQHNTTFLKYI